jgi:hypothetical protein
MKKFDLKKVAFATMMAMGVLFIVIAGAIIYGVSILYDFNSGLPGAVALVMIGVWVAYDFVSTMNRWSTESLSEMDLVTEDKE